ncbi:MAG: CARDB domain-containing protein [Solirubrobacterales bacterium]
MILVSAVGAVPAQGSGETSTYDFSMTPQQGSLSKTVKKPVDWRVEVSINAPFPQNPTVLPLKEIRANFPGEMTFNPDPKMPVCPDSQVGPNADLNFEPNTIIKRCPDSVVGNGVAYLYLARANSASGPGLKDAVLVAFNGGRNSQGQPVLKIYGYSSGVQTGVYMEGTLSGRKLTVPIPVLAFDSAVGYFDLNIPGSNSKVANRRGQTSDYVQTTCRQSPWKGDTEFTLGTRDTAGNPSSPDSILRPAPIQVPCKGTDGGGGSGGKGKLKGVKIKGPGKVKKGAKGTFKVTFKNSGKSKATGLKVTASGKGAKGSVKAGSLAPGRKKTVKVKVKYSKKGSIKTRFKVKSKNAGSASKVKTVKVG